MELAGKCPTRAKAPPGALRHVKSASILLTRRFSPTYKTKVSKTLLKCLRIGSCGVAIGPHCVANLYQRELQ